MHNDVHPAAYGVEEIFVFCLRIALKDGDVERLGQLNLCVWDVWDFSSHRIDVQYRFISLAVVCYRRQLTMRRSCLLLLLFLFFGTEAPLGY